MPLLEGSFNIKFWPGATSGDATQEEKVKTYNDYMAIDFEDLIGDYAVAKQEYDLNN